MRGIIEHVRGAGLALLWTMYIEITSILRYRFAFVSDVLVYTLVFALLMVVDAGQSLSRRYAYGDELCFLAAILLGRLRVLPFPRAWGTHRAS